MLVERYRVYGFTKRKDIGLFDTITKYFEKRGIDIQKIFAVTTDNAPAIVGE